MSLDFKILSVLFALAVTFHNLEEAIFLPDWFKINRHWKHPAKPVEFRFALAILTLLTYGLTVLVLQSGKESLSAYVISGYALAMLINLVFPHITATLLTRNYMPGLATALLFNLPVAILLLREGFYSGYLQPLEFIWSGPLTALILLLSLPLLFALGRKLFPT